MLMKFSSLELVCDVAVAFSAIKISVEVQGSSYGLED